MELTGLGLAWAPNVYEIDDVGRLKEGLCFLPVGDLVTGDVMLAQKIALETDEFRAIVVANRFSAARDLPRLLAREAISGRPRTWFNGSARTRI
jgi:hypothetical protein